MVKEQKVSEVVIPDIRILDGKLRRGEISLQEYNDIINALPDDEAFADYVEVYEEAADELTPHVNGPTFTA